MADADEKEEALRRVITESTERHFAKHGKEEKEIYHKAVCLACEVVSAWQGLYPALAIQPVALLTLQEMIWREVWGTFSTDKELDVRAGDLAQNPFYINDAIRAGLRHGEALLEEPEEPEETEPDDLEAMAQSLVEGLSTPETKH